MNGSSRCAGRVEVLHDQQWGSVCDNGWDTEDATVVCRQLGCGTVVSAPGSAWFGRGHDPIWLENVNCIGMEAALSECRAKPWGDHHCHHGEDAGVVCLGNPHPHRILHRGMWGYAAKVCLSQKRRCSTLSQCPDSSESLCCTGWETSPVWGCIHTVNHFL